MERERRDDFWGRVDARLDDELDVARGLTSAETTRVASSRAARLETELQNARRHGTTLQRIARAIHTPRDLPALLQLVVDLSVDASGAERGLVVVPDSAGESSELIAGSRFDVASLSDPESAYTRAIIERVCRSGAPVISLDDAPDQEEAPASVRALHHDAVICVPLRRPDQMIGAIYLDARRGPKSPFRYEPDLLLGIADNAALAIENARQRDELTRNYSEVSVLKSQNDQILEATSSGIVVVNREGIVTRFNKNAEETLGVTASSIVGHNVRLLNTWLPGITNLLERHIANHHEPLHAEINGQHFARGTFGLRITMIGVRDLRYRDAGTAIVLYDVTEGRAFRSERRLQVERTERITRSLERYLAPHVVRELLTHPDAEVLGGVRQTATTLFADINGFTEIAESMDPEAVVSLLNRYLDPLVDVVFNNGGLLDKFYGDGIMAVFGAPRPADDDAARAVTAARQMLDKVQLLNAQSPSARPLSVSIGLATGAIVAGHIGSSRRVEYTVIGDAVNLASRLEAIAEPGQILADERTYERVKHFVRATLRPTFIKGRSGPEAVYVLHG